MIQPNNKAKRIAEKLLGKVKENRASSFKEPADTKSQAAEQMDNMWRNQVQTTLHN